MTAAADERLSFRDMSEAVMRQWAEANPGRVNDRDWRGHTPLIAVAIKLKSLSLAVWLLDEKGANVNGTTAFGHTPLQCVASVDILTALLDRGAGPNMAGPGGMLPLMSQVRFGRVEEVARLLQDPRVRATVNVQNRQGSTALHGAYDRRITDAAPKAHLLLQASADTSIANDDGETPLDQVQGPRRRPHPDRTLTALLERYPGQEGCREGLGPRQGPPPRRRRQ